LTTRQKVFCSTALTSAGWVRSTLLSFVALSFAVN